MWKMLKRIHTYEYKAKYLPWVSLASLCNLLMTRKSLRSETCWLECWRILKSLNAKNIRKERFKDRKCIICWKHIDSLKLYVKTCWSKQCILKLSNNTKEDNWTCKECKRCWKYFESYNNRCYCDECQYNRICPICWWNIHWWRYETCWKKCAVVLTQKLHWEEYKEYAKVMHTEEAKKKASIWKKWRPNPKNRWPRYNRRWENHPLWRWWSSLWTRRSIQYSAQYKQLIKDIYTRDDYTCQICWKRWWNMLNVHHIRTWDYYPELRMDPNNLVTLCEYCHKKVLSLWWWTHWATETFSILYKLSHEL